MVLPANQCCKIFVNVAVVVRFLYNFKFRSTHFTFSITQLMRRGSQNVGL